MIPELEPQQPVIPRGACDIGNGYVLLRARDNVYRAMRDCEKNAFVHYLRHSHNLGTTGDWSPKVMRWARLRLPTGQVARSSWKESQKPLEKIRMARNVKVLVSFNYSTFLLTLQQFQCGQEIRFAMVLYYFRSTIKGISKTLAVVSVYSPPDERLLEMSYNILLSCTYAGDADLRVVEVESVKAVVAMVPHQPFQGDTVERYFVVEKPGLDVAVLAGTMEDIEDEE